MRVHHRQSERWGAWGGPQADGETELINAVLDDILRERTIDQGWQRLRQLVLLRLRGQARADFEPE